MLLYLALLSICFTAFSIEHLLLLQKSFDAIKNTRTILPPFVYTEQDAENVKIHMQKVLEHENDQAIGIEEQKSEGALAEFESLQSLQKTSPHLGLAVRELTRAYRSLKKHFKYCSCHSLSLRSDAILRIISHILHNYKTTDHIEYTSIGSGDLLQEALIVHMLQKYGYTDCTLNAIDILYFELLPTTEALLEKLHALTRKHGKQTMLDLYDAIQIKIANFKELFPEIELNTYQHGYFYAYRQGYFYHATGAKGPKKGKNITILTLIDPNEIGVELVLPGGLGTISLLSRTGGEAEVPYEELSSWMDQERQAAQELLDMEYPNLKNVICLELGQYFSDSLSHCRSLAYLPWAIQLPPFIISTYKMPYFSPINPIKKLLQTNYQQHKASQIGQIMLMIPQKQKVLATTNPYLIFFDIAATMMDSKGILFYTEPRIDSSYKRKLLFITQNIAQAVINAYITSMKYLAGTRAIGLLGPIYLHDLEKENPKFIEKLNNLDPLALDADILKPYYWYPKPKKSYWPLW